MGSSGVLTTGCGSQLDHGVLAVGYGVEDGTKYWKVKNSWGSSWGDSGYLKIERGAGGSGECGILMSASYPVVNSDASAGSVAAGAEVATATNSGACCNNRLLAADAP